MPKKLSGSVGLRFLTADKGALPLEPAGAFPQTPVIGSRYALIMWSQTLTLGPPVGTVTAKDCRSFYLHTCMSDETKNFSIIFQFKKLIIFPSHWTALIAILTGISTYFSYSRGFFSAHS